MSDRVGLSCALATPFAPDGSVDLPAMLTHAAGILAEGVDSVTLFGTTGEGASIGLAERQRVLGAFLGAGIEPDRVIVGVSAAASDDAVEQARAGYAAGCRALLFAPPFYFAEPGDDGLFAWFTAAFTRLGHDLRDVILYNIPSMTRATITPALMGRLRDAFPGALLGVKDSTGDWNSARAFLDRHRDLQVLVGDERLLARAVREGGGGTICGLANLVPSMLRAAAHEGRDDPRIAAFVAALGDDTVLASIKALVARRTGAEGWARMRAPLQALEPSLRPALHARVDAVLAARAA